MVATSFGVPIRFIGADTFVPGRSRTGSLHVEVCHRLKRIPPSQSAESSEVSIGCDPFAA
jgi:hypothetical protein